jgi:hypothetical protein
MTADEAGPFLEATDSGRLVGGAADSGGDHRLARGPLRRQPPANSRSRPGVHRSRVPRGRRLDPRPGLATDSGEVDRSSGLVDRGRRRRRPDRPAAHRRGRRVRRRHGRRLRRPAHDGDRSWIWLWRHQRRRRAGLRRLRPRLRRRRRLRSRRRRHGKRREQRRRQGHRRRQGADPRWDARAGPQSRSAGVRWSTRYGPADPGRGSGCRLSPALGYRCYAGVRHVHERNPCDRSGAGQRQADRQPPGDAHGSAQRVDRDRYGSPGRQLSRQRGGCWRPAGGSRPGRIRRWRARLRRR